ncbi:MAG TPA: hypothetical protein VE170_15265 [Candidatus Limnocylindria bacterium]|nr:hypothetical protein [Candidatus Limnocylindria bacterium]
MIDRHGIEAVDADDDGVGVVWLRIALEPAVILSIVHRGLSFDLEH